MSTESEVRELIDDWVKAVQAGDLAGVVAGHDNDIVMFDVPPPVLGIRGIPAYREAWPPFFDWEAFGAQFELAELDVTAGEDVAYAWALLRCGDEQDLREDPERRLRLTLGLRRVDGRWSVTHEHHSFTDRS